MSSSTALCLPSDFLKSDGEPVQSDIQGVFFTGPPPEKLKYGKPRLGEVTYILVDHPTQLICIWIYICCQHTSTKDIAGQSAMSRVDSMMIVNRPPLSLSKFESLSNVRLSVSSFEHLAYLAMSVCTSVHTPGTNCPKN